MQIIILLQLYGFWVHIYECHFSQFHWRCALRWVTTMTILGQCDSWRIKKKKTRRSKIITIIIIIRRRRNRFVRKRRFGGFVEKTMWHNDGCEKGKIIAGWRRCMVVGYHEAATASLTQFLRPAGAGSLRAILYTTTSHY